MTENENVTVTYVLAAMEPSALLERPAPVTVRNLGPSGHGIDVELRGTTRDVLRFVAEHWGEDEGRDAARYLGATLTEWNEAVAPLHAHEVTTLVEALHAHVDKTLADSADVIEDDETKPPHGTHDYDGRVRAFTFYRHGRDYRLLVEDVTLDAEHVAPGTDLTPGIDTAAYRTEAEGATGYRHDPEHPGYRP